MAIGTSADGIDALCFLAKGFDQDFPASILITVYLPLELRSHLDQLLRAAGPLPATFATKGGVLKKGRVYIAPPGCHLIMDEDRLWLGVGPRENNARPAIDPMLRSVAVCCGCRAIGVVLTGTLGDGASGLSGIEQAGGLTVVQDPKDAAFPEMPENALKRNNPDHVVHLRECRCFWMHWFVGRLAIRSPTDSLRYEVEISMEKMDWLGRRSVLTCPDCGGIMWEIKGGIMWEIKDGELSHYRCHIGHAYTEETIAAGVDERLKRALATALRAVDERVALVSKMSEGPVRACERIVYESK